MTSRHSPDTTRLAQVLEAPADPVCREIVAELDEPRTGPSLAACCETSSSTLYRKLDTLTACGVVEGRIEIESDFSHTTRYRVAIDELTVTVDDVRRVASRVDDATGHRHAEPTTDAT